MSAAQEIGTVTDRHVLLIDLSGIFRAAWHGSADQELNTAASKTLERVAQIREGHRYVVACLDSAPYKRRIEMLPTYKGQREKPTEVMLDQFRRVRSRLEADGLLMWRHPGEEADDVIASAVERAKREGFSVTIASSDKDLLQLVDDTAGVSVYSPAKDKTFYTADVVETWGVRPEMLLDSLALQGDKSDNIPSVPGVGPKKAAALLEQFGSFDAVFARCDEIKTPALMEAVAQNGEAARLARRIIALRTDLPIPWEELFQERKTKPVMQETPTIQEAEFDEVPISPPPAAQAPSAPTPTMAADAPKPTSTALAKAPVPWETALEPYSLKTAQDLSIAIFNSRMYPKLPNAEAIQVVIMRGRSLGLGAIQALDVIHYFEGKTAMHAHLITEMCMKDPDCEFFRFVGGDDTFAEYVTKHRQHADPVRLKYTIEMAKQAGLCPDTIRTRNPTPGEKDRRGMWEKRPGEQLRKTCAVQLGRIVYPGRTLGLYALEELGAETESAS
jgi:5'-3' exonuclease